MWSVWSLVGVPVLYPVGIALGPHPLGRGVPDQFSDLLQTCIGEAHNTGDPWPHLRVRKVKQLPGDGKIWRHTARVFYMDVNFQWTISVLWPRSWKLWVAVQVTTGGWDISWWPHYSLCILISYVLKSLQHIQLLPAKCKEGSVV